MLCVYSEKIASQCCIKLLILNEFAENASRADKTFTFTI